MLGVTFSSIKACPHRPTFERHEMSRHGTLGERRTDSSCWSTWRADGSCHVQDALIAVVRMLPAHLRRFASTGPREGMEQTLGWQTPSDAFCPHRNGRVNRWDFKSRRVRTLERLISGAAT